MCGIAGFQGEFEDSLLERMSAAIAHRGPDGSGAVILRSGGTHRVGLSHRRLAIIDPSPDGQQPMTSTCVCCGSRDLDDLALVFNGEIYNFRELRRELQQQGHQFHSGTDSEVLLHLYAEHGHDMLQRLNGIFAFAITDARERGRPKATEPGDIFIARDQLGVKPVYVAKTDSGLLFASELKALLQYGGISRELDHVALHQTLAYLWTPAPRTMLRGVQKLAPGTALIARGGRIEREWRYYDLPYGRAPLARHSRAIEAELRDRLKAAVGRQLVADVPVGAFLSGGLDSSSIVAAMCEIRPDHRPPCYTIGLQDDGDLDGSPADLPWARQVAAHLQVPLRALEVGPGIINELDRMLYHLDEPQADPAPINALLISEAARRDGIKVLLSGAGGDDIFTGYRRHRAAHFDRLWMRLPRELRAALAASSRRAGRFPGALSRRIARFGSLAESQGDRRTVAYFWWSTDQLRRSLYAPDIADELASEDAAEPLLASLARMTGDSDPVNRMLFLECRHFLGDHNLQYTDKMGMAAGVEVRVPFLDLELVDFATRIPPQLKQTLTTGKAILKRAMEPVLPRSVIYRPKTGFGAPMRRWLRAELAEKVRETLSPAALSARGLFDPRAVKRLLELDQRREVDATYTIFALLCVELWCQQFIDRTPASFGR